MQTLQNYESGFQLQKNENSKTERNLKEFFPAVMGSQQPSKSIGTKLHVSVTQEESLSPIALVWYTNMASNSMFWDTNLYGCCCTM